MGDRERGRLARVGELRGGLTLAARVRAPRVAVSAPSGALSFGPDEPARRFAGVALAGIAALAVAATAARWLPATLVDWPAAWTVPLAERLGAALNRLAREAEIAGVAVSTITRGIAAAFDAPIEALAVLLSSGVETGAGFNRRRLLPPLSWLGLSLALVLLAWRLGAGAASRASLRRRAGLALAWPFAAGLGYLVAFGLWREAMLTVANVLLCVGIAAALGLAIGVAAHRSARTEALARGAMNVMQTVPVFAYLIPTLLLFGYGPSAALIATIAYALPPMVHATVLALRDVPVEVREYARMAGCNRRQRLWRVELPVALPTLAIGLNQVVMMSLNMVIIASMIGAGGLGYEVLRALRKLDIGAGLEAGLGIVVVAVLLDLLTQALARRGAAGARGAGSSGVPGRAALPYLALILGTTLASLALPALASWPEPWQASTATWWNELLSAVNRRYFDALEAVRVGVLLGIMYPLRDALLALPWSVAIAALAALGARLGGPALALRVAALAGFVLLTGHWDEAMVSLYLVLVSVAIALVAGLPLGLWLSARPRLREPASLVLDTLQTLPTLVYLLPAVMLFRNGDFTAMIAIVAYALAPAVRYAMHGFASVPAERVEAAAMVGCDALQTLRRVRLPAALPSLVLGLNQTVMMALSMLVIAALVGTRDLGQEVYVALTRAQPGHGLVAGLAVAAIALVFDALLKGWARRASPGADPSR